MLQRRFPVMVRTLPNPRVRSLAVLAAAESAARGILISVFPIVMYRSLGDARAVSEIYFLVGILSMLTALFVPWLTRFVPRRWVYTAGAATMIAGNLCAATGIAWLAPVALAAVTTAVVVITVCFNAYVMDYIERSSLGDSESTRLFYSGAAWTVGPFLGVWLMNLWPPAPFLVSIVACIALLVIFWVLRLGDGKVIVRARRPAANPLAYLPRFFAQPRLIAGWTFAVIRSSGWWVYAVCLPIYAVEHGYGERLGGIALSLSNGLLFLAPVMLRWVRSTNVRHAVVVGFLGSGAAFAAATLAAAAPAVVLVMLMLGSAFLILLDVAAGLPYLMAVKPSERTEMAAVYSTFRDVSGVLSPGVVRLVLTAAPLVAVFAACGLGLVGCGLLALKLHPRLGQRRLAGA